MKKLLFLVSFLWSLSALGQSYLYNNAVVNLKDPRSSSIYKYHYLNNTDSILSIDSVGLNLIRAARFKAWATSGRPAFAVAGMIGYNSDSAKLEFYNGSAWGSLSASTSASYTAGSGLTLTGSQFKLGGTISENTSLSTGGTYTWELTDGTTPIIHSDANERVSIGGTNNAGNKFYVNGTFGGADGSVLFSFAAASLQYYAPSSDMIIRLNGRGEEWRMFKSTSEFVLYPVTTNADPFRIKDNALATIFEIDFSNKYTKLNYLPVATSNDTKLLVKGSSDSAIRQLDFPITSTTYTVTLTNTTNIASSSTNTTYYQRLGDVVHVWGEFTATATATGVCEMGFSIPVSSAFASSYDGAGTGSSDAYSVRIYADATNDRMTFRWTAPNTSATTHSFHFTYKYIAP